MYAYRKESNLPPSFIVGDQPLWKRGLPCASYIQGGSWSGGSGGGCKVIGTGGLVNVIQHEIDIFDSVNQDLTLAGLRIIYELNPK